MGHLERREVLRLLTLGVPGIALTACSASSSPTPTPTPEPTPILEPTRTPYPSPQSLPGGPRNPDRPTNTPTPRPETKEKMQDQSFKLHPIAKVETKKAPQGHEEEGWKWIYIILGVENTSKDWIPLPRISGEIKTKEGYLYPILDQTGVAKQAISLGYYPQEVRKILNMYNRVRIPPGFIVMGVMGLPLRLTAKIGEKTTPAQWEINRAKLDLPSIKDFSGMSNLDLKDILPKDLHLPTSRPDSDFRAIGSPFEISTHSSLTIQTSAKPPSSPNIVVTTTWNINIENKNIGQEERISVKFMGYFDNEGMLYFDLEEPAPQQIIAGPGVSKSVPLKSQWPLTTSYKYWLQVNGRDEIITHKRR